MERAISFYEERFRCSASNHITFHAWGPRELRALILPGVGHFALMRSLGERSLVKPLREAVSRGTPLLGICLGLRPCSPPATKRRETLASRCFLRKFPPASSRSPHMGWNQLRRAPQQIAEGVPQDAYFYSPLLRRWMPGGRVACGSLPRLSPCRAGNVFATQFHPRNQGRSDANPG